MKTYLLTSHTKDESVINYWYKCFVISPLCDKIKASAKWILFEPGLKKIEPKFLYNFEKYFRHNLKRNEIMKNL
jgi:hypothetical protein